MMDKLAVGITAPDSLWIVQSIALCVRWRSPVDRRPCSVMGHVADGNTASVALVLTVQLIRYRRAVRGDIELDWRCQDCVAVAQSELSLTQQAEMDVGGDDEPDADTTEPSFAVPMELEEPSLLDEPVVSDAIDDDQGDVTFEVIPRATKRGHPLLWIPTGTHTVYIGRAVMSLHGAVPHATALSTARRWFGRRALCLHPASSHISMLPDLGLL
ncbi:hypothetical protein ACOMHN_032197 [Nucella lapillus]